MPYVWHQHLVQSERGNGPTAEFHRYQRSGHSELEAPVRWKGQHLRVPAVVTRRHDAVAVERHLRVPAVASRRHAVAVGQMFECNTVAVRRTRENRPRHSELEARVRRQEQYLRVSPGETRLRKRR